MLMRKMCAQIIRKRKEKDEGVTTYYYYVLYDELFQFYANTFLITSSMIEIWSSIYKIDGIFLVNN